MATPFAVNMRLSIGDQRCTVKYVGPLPNTTPEGAPWLGIQWDDASRGKHDGRHEGVRYFDCSGPQSGSFLRPTSKKIHRPRPFLQVGLERYLPATEAPSSTRSADDQATTATSAPLLTLGSSSIQVAAPNLDKVRDRLGRVTALRELGADDALVGFLGDGEEDEMRKMGPWRTRHLNLSKSLFTEWDQVDAIVGCLDELDGLDLTLNRFPGPSSMPVLLPAFQRLTDLNLTATHLPLSDVLQLEPSLPNLQSLTFASNNLNSFDLLPSHDRREKWFANLKELRLDWNEFDDWGRLGFLGELADLRYLSLSHNRLPSLPLTNLSYHPIPLPPKLETLHLANNQLADWETIDLLNERLNSLKVLWLGGNPLTAAGAPVPNVEVGLTEEERDRRETRRIRDVRARAIARLRGLVVLDGSEVSAGERRAAEQDYLLSRPPAFVDSNRSNGQESVLGQARWDELVARYGALDDASSSTVVGKDVTRPAGAVLKDKLFDLAVELLAPSPPVQMRFLPSTPLRTVLLKISKHLSLSAAQRASVRLVRVPSGDGGEEELEGPKRTLQDLGVEQGDSLRVTLDDV